MVRLLLSTDFDCKSLSRCSNHVTKHQYIKSLVSLYEYEVHHLYTPTQKFLIIIINIRPGHLIMESFTWPLDHGIVYCTCTVHVLYLRHPRPHPHRRFSHALHYQFSLRLISPRSLAVEDVRYTAHAELAAVDDLVLSTCNFF